MLYSATGAQNHCRQSNFESKKPLLILDLSIRKNKSRCWGELDGVTLIHMDYLSQLTDETLENRKKAHSCCWSNHWGDKRRV
jgi:glutamyl-tRNA reductase